MQRFLIAAAAALSSVTLFPVAASACSVVDGYRVPTNLELVRQAPLILRGRVIGEDANEDRRERALLIEPVEAIKGDLPSGTLQIRGMGLVPDTDERGFGILSNPYEFRDAHPLSYIGACIRYMFPQGTTALFFLDQREGEWVPAGGPFSRWAEDVIGNDAPWLVLTRFYAAVQTADPADRRPIMEAERDRLLALEDDPVAPLIARDIDRQLEGPNEPWYETMRSDIESEDAADDAADAVDAIEEARPGRADDDTGLADAMEEEAEEAVLCVESSDGNIVACGGEIYRKDTEL